jgi:hypothetical protein
MCLPFKVSICEQIVSFFKKKKKSTGPNIARSIESVQKTLLASRNEYQAKVKTFLNAKVGFLFLFLFVSHVFFFPG